MTRDRKKKSPGWREGSVVKATLAAPTVPAIIDQNDPDGLVSTGTHLNGLEVLVPIWPNTAGVGQTDILELYWSGAAGVPAATERFDGPVNSALFPFSLKLDKNFLQPDGRYEVWYTVKNDSGAVAISDLRTLTIDSHPPSYNQQLLALLLPTDLSGGQIDEAYLANHNDQVELRLPSPLYLDAQDGDVIDLYWSQDNPPSSAAVASTTVNQAQIDANDIRIDLPGSVIRGPDRDGSFYVTYKVRDRAGNETPTFSRETAATVTLKPLPGGDLPEPTFPDATLQGYIHCAHEPWNGIRVRVEFVRNLFEYQDEITLYWQGYRTLNGNDPIVGTEGVFAWYVNAENVANGYADILVKPYIPHIEPIVEGSAIASYRLTKVNGPSGGSYEGLVKINRQLPDGELCGPVPPAIRSVSRAKGGCSICRKGRSFLARLFRALGRGGRGN